MDIPTKCKYEPHSRAPFKMKTHMRSPGKPLVWKWAWLTWKTGHSILYRLHHTACLPQLCCFWPWNFQNRLPQREPRAHFCGFRAKWGFSLLERDGGAKWAPFPSCGTSLGDCLAQGATGEGKNSVRILWGLRDSSWPHRALGRKKQFQHHDFSEAKRPSTTCASEPNNPVIILQGGPKR